MGITRSAVKVGQKPPKEMAERIREAAKYPIVYTEDCPESTPEALQAFALLAAERNRRNRRQAVTIRVDVKKSFCSKGRAGGRCDANMKK